MSKLIALFAFLTASAVADCEPDYQCTLYDAELFDEISRSRWLVHVTLRTQVRVLTLFLPSHRPGLSQIAVYLDRAQ